MATRNISTKLAIEGESEYRASISRINSELKAMQSALKLTESQYQTNANSMEALKAKGDALKAVYDTQKRKVDELRSAMNNSKQAQQEWADKIASTKQKLAENEAALEKLKKATGDTTAEQKRLTEEGEKLREQLAREEAGFAAAEKGTNNWQTQLNSAQIQLNNIDAEIQKNAGYMAEAEKSADGCATSIDEFGHEVDDTAESVKDLGTILASSQIQEFAEKVTAAIQDSVRSFADFESGMAKVKRTTGMSDEQIKDLGERFKQLSTEIPVTTGELAAIAESAGQLGIRNSEIEGFTVTIAKLAAATNMTSDKAATMTAQFANVTGLSTQDDYSRLASTVAALGDSSAVTGEKILDMAQGMGAIGKVSGMSAKDVLAIATAVGSAGIEAAAGSTSMNRLMQSISRAVTKGGDDLATFAQISGMSKEEFVAHWKTDAVGALDSFIKGLGEADKAGTSSIELLDKLGITQERERATIQSIATAQYSLRDAIEAANTSWSENRALDEKAATAAETLSGKMDMLQSASDNLKIAFGEALAPVVGDLAEDGTSLLNHVTTFIEKHPELTKALTLVAGGFTGIVTAVASAKAAYKGLSFLGMTKPLETIAASAEAAGGGIAGLAAALGTVALPSAIAATALASVAAIVDEIKTTDTVGFLGQGHTLEEYSENVDHYREEIERLKVEYDNLANCGADLTMIQNELDHATIGLAHAQEELAAAEAAAAQAHADAIEATQADAEAVEYRQALNESIVDSINGIVVAWRASYDECKTSLEGQIGLFDKFMWSVNENADTAKEMLEIWDAQAQNIENYGENLRKAAEFGLDTRLIQQLSDGSADSAGYLATLVTEIEKAQTGMEGAMAGSAEEAVAKFNEAFAKTEEAREKASVTMAAINSDVAAQLGELEQLASEVDFQGFWDAVDTAFGNVSSEFAGIGSDAIGGMIVGINRESGALYSTVFSVVATAMEAARAGADTHSPSKKTDKIFQDVGQGMIVGIKKKEADVKEATRSVAAAAVRFDSGEVARLAASVSAAVPDFGSLLGDRQSGSQERNMTRTVHIEAPITINAKEGQDVRELAREVGYALAEFMDSKG